jgi:NAD(P)-dependent dehydrogenase (short-subunit alcohol dehydrogenase family)
VLDLDEDAAHQRAQEIRSDNGTDAMGLKVDATRREDLDGALDQVIAEWGRVDVLLNAPGINSATPFFDITEQEWQRILDVNLRSMFIACQVFGQRLIDQGDGGSVINVSSASSGPPLSKVFTYSITKAGINNLTQFLAREWAPHRVRVNAIAPGFFPAEQNRKVRTGSTRSWATPRWTDSASPRSWPVRWYGWRRSARPRSLPARSCGWTVGSLR